MGKVGERKWMQEGRKKAEIYKERKTNAMLNVEEMSILYVWIFLLVAE
jgi:hypothetical protein